MCTQRIHLCSDKWRSGDNCEYFFGIHQYLKKWERKEKFDNVRGYTSERYIRFLNFYEVKEH